MINSRINRRKLYYENRKIGMSLENAALAAGYPRSLIEKHTVTGNATSLCPIDFVSEFERKRLTTQNKVDHILSGMNAMRLVSVEVDGETTKNGKKVYQRVEVPDWTARHKYCETMLKLCKHLTPDSQTNVLVVGDEFIERLRKARERVDADLRVRFEDEKKEIRESSEFVRGGVQEHGAVPPAVFSDAEVQDAAAE